MHAILTKYKVILFLVLGGVICFQVLKTFRRYKNDKLSEQFSAVRENALDLNSIRRQADLPVIEKDWNIVRQDSIRSVWAFGDKSIYTSRPFHLSKTIIYHDRSPIIEVDEFHFEESDTRSYRLVIRAKYSGPQNLERAEQKLIQYYAEGVYPPTSSRPLTKAQADSVLHKWKLR